MKTTLNFPQGKPDAYIRLDNEPPFDPARHLALEMPAATTDLAELGYDEATIATCPSRLGVTTPFRIFSNEGLAVVQDLTARMKSNRNAATGTGKNRLGSYIRGAGYRSKFLYDFCECRDLLDFLSALTGAPLGRHTVPAVACGINYAPEDITRAIDTWHVDSVSFDAVILLTDPQTFRGGQFEYFHGTKSEGETILGGRGEAGSDTTLPAERVTAVAFPAAGYGFVQQGNMVFHRACRLLERAERTTLLPSFVVLGGGKNSSADATNVSAMSRWGDPGLLTELARHEAWLARGRLQQLIDELPLDASREEIATAVAESAAGLNRFAGELREAP